MNKLKIAPKYLAKIMRMCNVSASPSLWNIGYILPEHRNNAYIRHHTMVHLEQMSTDGKIKWLFKYFWWMLVKGYKQHPYEKEANSLNDF